MKIKVIFTGGTISSAESVNGLSVNGSEQRNKILISNYLNKSKNKNIEFDVSQPLNVLSENITLDDINIFIEELKNTDLNSYDGIIIAHGTDTLAYTSNILSVLLLGISIPVVLVSSNYILTDEKANGNINFAGAVDFITDQKLPGVYSVYMNSQGKIIVYSASELKQCLSVTNEFSSSCGVDFGYMKDNIFVKNESSYYPSVDVIKASSKNDLIILNSIDKLYPYVMMIQPYTGIDYNSFNLNNNIKAVLHGLYHASTACVATALSYNSSIINFAQQCKNNDIDLYIAPYDNSVKLYETTVKMLDNNIIPLGNISIEQAYARLLIFYSLNDEKLKQKLKDIIF